MARVVARGSPGKRSAPGAQSAPGVPSAQRMPALTPALSQGEREQNRGVRHRPFSGAVMQPPPFEPRVPPLALPRLRVKAADRARQKMSPVTRSALVKVPISATRSLEFTQPSPAETKYRWLSLETVSCRTR